MEQRIKTITLPLPYRMGSVNCYLIETDTGYVLIDTGGKNARRELEDEIAAAGCKTGNLKLIILTHGDFDHIGSAVFLKEKFGTEIAMHPDDSGMAELGDMFWNRKTGKTIIKIIAPLLFGFRKTDRFVPDLYVDDGYVFSEYGFDATVLSIPGHSKGSIGILMSGGDLVCGDLYDNTSGPVLHPIMDDPNAANASVEKLKGFVITKIYPGHGEPFAMEQIIKQ